MISRLAAHALHARIIDSTAHTAPARQAFLNRFEREVDPEGILTADERARRAEHARKAYFGQLARKSVKTRQRRSATAKRVESIVGEDLASLSDEQIRAALLQAFSPAVIESLTDQQLANRTHIAMTAAAVIDAAIAAGEIA